MPLKQIPKVSAQADKLLEIATPAIGGLNLKDLEYELETNQSPKMLNVMYRNGSFSKRYGQNIKYHFDDEIYATSYFNDCMIIHAGDSIYKKSDTETIIIGTGLQETKGLFINYNMGLYYLCGGDYYQYVFDYKVSDYVWGAVTPYVPEVYSECKPDGTESNEGDELNVLCNYFEVAFSGDGTSTDYKIGKIVDDYRKNIINWSGNITVTIDGTVIEEDTTSGTTVAANKFKRITSDRLIRFGSSAKPALGDDNCIIKMTLNKSIYETQRDCILNAKCYGTYGGIDNSRLFLGGFGDIAKGYYIYSDAVDATFFPIYNYEVVGNSSEDIVGFGLQYNTMFIFKPSEIYSLISYTQTYATTADSTEVGMEAFKAQLVNGIRGCDAPNTIQLIDNKLTWFHSKYGVCTLVSSSVIDERNVRSISRNIDRTNNFDVKGILDFNEDLNSIVSTDYDNKYFLVFPNEGKCFVWDYQISPYIYTNSKETEVKNLDWFLFDNFYVKEFINAGTELYYVGTNKEIGDGKTGSVVNIRTLNSCVVHLNLTFADLDFNKDGTNDAINSYYMTPLLQFGAVEYLKTIKNIYIECRGVNATSINMKCITEENPEGEEQEPIYIGSNLWGKFNWVTYAWSILNFMSSFRRKCSVKKVQAFAIYFYNNLLNADMSISHLALQYQIIKFVK